MTFGSKYRHIMSNTKNNNVGDVKGFHAIIEHRGLISRMSCNELERLLRDSASAAGATVLGANFHDFGDGVGNTGVLMLAESHISVHTWPENNYAAIDIFVCSNQNDSGNDLDGLEPVEAAIEVLRTADKHGCFHYHVIHRTVPLAAAPMGIIPNTLNTNSENNNIRSQNENH